jgi:hypothetical protein
MLGRRWPTPPVSRKAGCRKGRQKREGETGFGLLAVLALFKPTLPNWLPVSVYQGFMMVERLDG